MIYILIGMGLLFVAIRFIVTEQNAKYLLSGYNTLSEEDKKQVDIKAYIPYFRNFHLFLGISFIALGLFLLYFVGENAVGIFLAVYPSIAYIYFIATSSKFAKGIYKKKNTIAMLVLTVSLLIIVGISGYGFKENNLLFDSESVSFESPYGETISKSEIQSIELVSQLPEITFKTNGFALGSVRKGYFKLRNGETVKLILNSDQTPILLLTKNDGTKIYYSAKEKPNNQILAEIKTTLPDINYR